MINPLEAQSRMRAIFDTLILLFVSLFGFVIVGPFIGALCALPFLSTSVIELEDVLRDFYTSPDGKLLLYFMQAGATTGMLALPLLYFRFKLNGSYRYLSERPPVPLLILLSLSITFCFMVVNSVFINWNANFYFPEWLHGFEEWARQTEAAATRMTEFMTDFEGAGHLVLSLVVMAVLPAIAEETVFRGLVQRRLHDGFNNVHMAIWVSGILFSAIHLQFFGFLPRLLLGVLFGYLYYWSGSLLVPVAAHFFNNAFTLLMIYLFRIGVITYDIQDMAPVSLASVIIFAIITLLLLNYFRKVCLKSSDG